MSESDLRDDYDDESPRRLSTVENVVKPASNLIRWCGMFQLVASILAVLLIAAGFVEYALNVRLISTWDLIAAQLIVPVGLAGIVLTPIALSGATAMRQMRRHSLAVAACVITILSVPCVLAIPVTAPIGIWGLMVLYRHDVRARFEDVARGTIETAPPEARDARTDRAA